MVIAKQDIQKYRKGLDPKKIREAYKPDKENALTAKVGLGVMVLFVIAVMITIAIKSDFVFAAGSIMVFLAGLGYIIWSVIRKKRENK